MDSNGPSETPKVSRKVSTPRSRRPKATPPSTVHLLHAVDRAREALRKEPSRTPHTRQGFFEHTEYLVVRAHLPAPWQDVIDMVYYSGWRPRSERRLGWPLVPVECLPINILWF